MKIKPELNDWISLRETAIQIIKSSERDLMLWVPNLKIIEKNIRKLEKKGKGQSESDKELQKINDEFKRKREECQTKTMSKEERKNTK